MRLKAPRESTGPPKPAEDQLKAGLRKEAGTWKIDSIKGRQNP